jgi:radical SAM protein with 4Fe4S-binding SPASM domain
MLGAARIDGQMAPCSFTPRTELRVGELARGWADDPGLAPYRAYVAAPAEPCASCTLRAVCKGGCKVVSDFASGTVGPDPECPRVRAHARAAAS